MNPDLMRLNKGCVEFAQHFLETGKPWLLFVMVRNYLLKQNYLLAEK